MLRSYRGVQNAAVVTYDKDNVTVRSEDVIEPASLPLPETGTPDRVTESAMEFRRDDEGVSIEVSRPSVILYTSCGKNLSFSSLILCFSARFSSF